MYHWSPQDHPWESNRPALQNPCPRSRPWSLKHATCNAGITISEHPVKEVWFVMAKTITCTEGGSRKAKIRLNGQDAAEINLTAFGQWHHFVFNQIHCSVASKWQSMSIVHPVRTESWTSQKQLKTSFPQVQITVFTVGEAMDVVQSKNPIV